MTLKEWLDDMVEKEMEEWTAVAEEAIRTEAHAQGLEEGREEGLAEGHEEGKREGEVEMFRKLYQKGFDVIQIADMLDLDEEYISAIYELLQKYPEKEDRQIAKLYMQKKE